MSTSSSSGFVIQAMPHLLKKKSPSTFAACASLPAETAGLSKRVNVAPADELQRKDMGVFVFKSVGV